MALSLSSLVPTWLRRPLARLAGSDSSWLGIVGRPGMTTGAGEPVTPDTAQGLSPVYACARVLTDALCAVDFRLLESLPTGGTRVVQGTDAAKALSTWDFESKELAFWSMLVGGNGFVQVVRNARGGIGSLNGLAPRYMTLEVDEAFRVFYRHRDRFAREALYTSDEMVHLKYRSTEDEFLALPPIVSAAEAVGNALAVRGFSSALFRNGVFPSFTLQTDSTLNDDAIERLRKQFAESYGGAGNTGKPLLLEAGTKANPLGMANAEQAQMIESSRFGVAEVSRLYGVPMSMLSEPGDANYSTSVEERRAFVSNTLRPLVVRVADALTARLVPSELRATLRVHADLSHLTVGDGKEQAEWLSALLSAGALNINEARERLGLPDVTGGDVYRVPVNSVALQNLTSIGVPAPAADTVQGAAKVLRIVGGSDIERAAIVAPTSFREAVNA